MKRKCSDCGKELNVTAKDINEHNDVFCEDCLDTCSKCGRKFADYIGDGICEDCAD